MIFGLTLGAVLGPSWLCGQVRLHSHNDYNRRPALLRALRYGAESIEVDLFVRKDRVCVAHLPWGVRKKRTLENRYLEPMRRILARNGGSVYGDSKPVVVYFDFKERAEKIFPALDRTLERYRPMFAVFSDTGTVRDGPLRIVVEHRTGKTDVYGHAARSAGNGARTLMVFDKYANVKDYRLPAGAPYRIYAAPDGPKHWRKQMEAGVGYLHTNRLKAARKFLDAWYAKR